MIEFDSANIPASSPEFPAGVFLDWLCIGPVDPTLVTLDHRGMPEHIGWRSAVLLTPCPNVAQYKKGKVIEEIIICRFVALHLEHSVTSGL